VGLKKSRIPLYWASKSPIQYIGSVDKNYIVVCFNFKSNYLLFLMLVQKQYGDRTEPAHDASEGRFLYDGDSIDIVLRGKQ
jgi:hypothetical protein